MEERELQRGDNSDVFDEAMILELRYVKTRRQGRRV